MFDIRELSIVLLAENHNPTILNPDFLKYNEIVPFDWELAESPVCVDSIAQVFYKNDIRIIAQFDRLNFTENISSKLLEDIDVPNVSSKYIEVLPHVNYRAIGINPRGHVVVQNQHEADIFVLNKLVSKGPWTKFKNTIPKATVQFNYPLDFGFLILKVEDTILSLPNEEKVPAIVFSGNFHRDVSGGNTNEIIEKLKKIIKSWSSDVELFKELIEESFLKD